MNKIDKNGPINSLSEPTQTQESSAPRRILVRPFFEPENQESGNLNNRQINVESFELIFRRNLENLLTKTEKLEQSAKKKTTAMKVLFVGLLILGLVCAASFFLLPILGSIAGAVGISVAATKIAWQAIFLGGGLIASLSFIPRRFIGSFVADKEHYHEKAQEIRQLLERNFRNFLTEELLTFTHHEVIAASPDFAELYYLKQEIHEKRNDLEGYQQELNNIQQVLNTTDETQRKVYEKQIKSVNKKLKQMRREISAIENDMNKRRVNLNLLDRQ